MHRAGYQDATPESQVALTGDDRETGRMHAQYATTGQIRRSVQMMIRSVLIRCRRPVSAALLCAAALGPLLASSPALAWWRGGFTIGIAPPLVYPPPIYYPPPVYYPPPPVVHAPPPPAAYAPPQSYAPLARWDNRAVLLRRAIRLSNGAPHPGRSYLLVPRQCRRSQLRPRELNGRGR